MSGRAFFPASFVFALFSAIVACVSLAQDEHPAKQARYIMGTVCEISIYRVPEDLGPPDTKRQNLTDVAFDAAFEELKIIDAELSIWKEDSELMRMNRAAAAAGSPRPAVKVSDLLFGRVQAALEMARATSGSFDPTVGPLVRYYGFLPKQPRASRKKETLAELKSRVGWQKVRLDASNRTVTFDVPGMEIDLGGIAKGYAAERAAQVLREHGVTAGFVNLGESSMAAIGHPPREKWLVEVYDPRDRRSAVAELDLQDGESLATSGIYENVRGAGTKRRAHIIDPRSGNALPAGPFSVTVVMKGGEQTDALTKAFFFARQLDSAAACEVLARFPQASVMLVSAKGEKPQIQRGGAQPERFRLIEPSAPAR